MNTKFSTCHFLQRRWDDGGKIWVEYQVLCHQNSPLHSVFFFYRVFTDLRNTQQQQTVYLSIYLLAYVYIPAKLGRGSKNFCVGFTYYAWVFFRIGLIFDASPPPVYVSLTNVIWREKRGGIYICRTRKVCLEDKEKNSWNFYVSFLHIVHDK